MQLSCKICLVIIVTGTLIFTIKRNLNFCRFCSIEHPDYFNPYIVRPNKGPDLEILPNLTALKWPKLNRPSKRSKENEMFSVTYTNGNYHTSQTLLQKFQSTMISLNLQDQWFLGGGTLIGSQRHHDIIPWDDDVDIYVNVKHRIEVVNALKALAPEFSFYESKLFDKFYFALQPGIDASDPNVIGSFKFSPFPWNWPFVDIFYFQQFNKTHFFNEWFGTYYFQSSDINPTVYRPLGHNWYPTPRNPLSFLLVYYANDHHLCKSAFYSHATETNRNSVSMNCSKLVGQYAFVHRCPVKETERMHLKISKACDEYLVSGNGTIFHKIRTFLECNDSENDIFAVHNSAFSCP